jgi:hypothetical protein
MSASDAPVHGSRRSRRGIVLAARVCVLAFFVTCLLAASAWATRPPQYSLSIVEGETTQPENVIAHTSAEVRQGSGLAVSIIRGGITVYRDTGEHGAWLSQVPQVGDVVTVESPVGTVVGSVVYDGLPTLDPTVCAGSINFSGQRSAGQTVEGGYFSVSPSPYFERGNAGQAQVTSLSGASFGGSFLKPLAAGETVWASESLETPLPGGAVFTYSSENSRPVGACPAPPPPVVAPAPPALQGSILKLLHTTLHAFLKSGWRDQVGINQAGTVTQDLYLVGGTLPAFAASGHRVHKKPPPALLLARATATAKTAGTVTLVLRLTPRGRARLRVAKNARVVLLTTLHSASGAKLVLERKSVTLHR